MCILEDSRSMILTLTTYIKVFSNTQEVLIAYTSSSEKTTTTTAHRRAKENVMHYSVLFIQGILKRYGQNLKRYSLHLKNEKMLYEHECGNAFLRVMLKILLRRQ